MSDIESEIQSKGLTAPRVTPADIEAEIASEHYFTAADGVEFNFDRPNGPYNVGGVPPSSLQTLGLLTFAVLVLKNGFTVTGESACASPENFDAEIGRKIARTNAVNKIWPLLGFRLRDKLSRVPCTLYRDAASGELVTAEYAAQNPATTVKETR